MDQVQNVKHGVQQFKGFLEKSDSQLLSVERRLTKELDKAGSRIRALNEESSALQDAGRKMFEGLKRAVTKSSKEFAVLLREKTKEKRRMIGAEKHSVEEILKETQKCRSQCMVNNYSMCLAEIIHCLENLSL
jgi:hypothetical protein